MPATGWSSIATGELEVSMLAETAVTGVAMTTLTPGLNVEPVSLALNYFRPIRPQAGNLLARASSTPADCLFSWRSRSRIATAGRLLPTPICAPSGAGLLHPRCSLLVQPGQSFAGLAHSTSFFGAVPADGRLLRAEARGMIRGRGLAIADIDVYDADGQLAASAQAVAQLIDSSKRQKQTVSEVKRILATLLFTDIVGSTEHARRLGVAAGGPSSRSITMPYVPRSCDAKAPRSTRRATGSLSASIPLRARSNVPGRRERP
jgi:acyl-coenzyme A thioesterase PaaI-like protein